MSTTTTELNLETILYAKKGAIAYVTLNRPKVLNALNKRTWEDLKAAFEDAQDDAAVRGVILTGAGDKAFIAGADINELAQITAVGAAQSSAFGQGVLDLIENLGKPVIAAVNGFALGGGCETAMACTIRIAVENAKFGQPEVKLGVIPGGGGTQRLPRLVGRGRTIIEVAGESRQLVTIVAHLHHATRQCARNAEAGLVFQEWEAHAAMLEDATRRFAIVLGRRRLHAGAAQESEKHERAHDQKPCPARSAATLP